MHSLHTLLPSHGQRYKRNLPRHQCAAQCACPAGGQGGNPPWAMGFHGANRVSASSALLHWRRGEGEKGRSIPAARCSAGTQQIFSPIHALQASAFAALAMQAGRWKNAAQPGCTRPLASWFKNGGGWWHGCSLRRPPLRPIAALCGPLQTAALLRF